MGPLILGVNTVYIAFCFVRTLAMVGKGLRDIYMYMYVSFMYLYNNSSLSKRKGPALIFNAARVDLVWPPSLACP